MGVTLGLINECQIPVRPNSKDSHLIKLTKSPPGIQGDSRMRGGNITFSSCFFGFSQNTERKQVSSHAPTLTDLEYSWVKKDTKAMFTFREEKQYRD